MALIVCPDCTRQVSPKARHCVHCGRPWPAKKGSWLRKLILAAIIGGLGFGGYAFTSNWNSNKSFRASMTRTLDRVLDEVKELKGKVTGGAPSKAEKLDIDPAEKERLDRESD